MAKIILYLKGCPRGSFQKLTGRSGFIYDVAHFKDATQRHETKEFDLEDFQTRILPDIEKFPSTLRWWPVVRVEPAGEEVQRLMDELSAANLVIEHLQSEAAKPAPADPFAGLATGIALTGQATATGITGTAVTSKPLTDLKYRELRELCKNREIAVTGSTTKEDMIALLNAPVTPVVEPTPEPTAALDPVVA